MGGSKVRKRMSHRAALPMYTTIHALVGILDKPVDGEGGIGSMGQRRRGGPPPPRQGEEKDKPAPRKERRAAAIPKEESSHTRQANERNDCSRSGHEDHDQHQDLEEEKRRALAAQREILRTCNFQANRQPTRQGTTVTGTGAFTFASQVFRNTCKARCACLRIIAARTRSKYSSRDLAACS